MYRLINSPADLGDLPEELRRPVEGCLAKQPSSRPTASRLLAQLGAVRPSAFAEEVVARPDPGATAGRAGAALAVSSAATTASPARMLPAWSTATPAIMPRAALAAGMPAPAALVPRPASG